jgi:nitrite reductase/ring-hydroxylating ferredoxin subunit
LKLLILLQYLPKTCIKQIFFRFCAKVFDVISLQLKTLFPFMPSLAWYRLFKTLEEAEAQIPLKGLRAVQAGTLRLCLARTAQGFFVLQDACPHRMASLSEGFLNDFEEVVCPLHHYRFHVASGRVAGGTCADAQSYTIRIDHRGFCVGIPE